MFEASLSKSKRKRKKKKVKENKIIWFHCGKRSKSDVSASKMKIIINSKLKVSGYTSIRCTSSNKSGVPSFLKWPRILLVSFPFVGRILNFGFLPQDSSVLKCIICVAMRVWLILSLSH